MHRPLKGQCQMDYGFIFYYWRAKFFIFGKSSRRKFFLTTRGIIRVGHPFFSKERNVLTFFCVLSKEQNVLAFAFFIKRTLHSLYFFTFFIKERCGLCVLLHSLLKNAVLFAFFYVLYKRMQRSLHSFTFFIKECGILCVLLRSL